MVYPRESRTRINLLDDQEESQGNRTILAFIGVKQSESASGENRVKQPPLEFQERSNNKTNRQE